MLAVVAYVVLALWATWPLARVATRSLPLSTMTASTVPLFNLWTVWWNADRLRHGFSGYWNAPIFYPLPETFAFSEPQPATLTVAPIIWLTGSRALAYNVYIWLSLVLNGVFAERLLRLQGVRRWTAFAGGAAMLLLPIVHWQREVLQLVPVWGILWTWAAFLGISRERALRRGCELGAAFAVTCFLCVHHALFLALLLAGTSWVLGKRLFSWRIWAAFAVAGGVAAALAGPVLLPIRDAVKRYEFTRKSELVMRLSATPGDYAALSGTPLIDPHLGPRWAPLSLAPGWLKLCLAGIALPLGLWRRRWRRWTLFLLTTGLLGFACSLGLRLNVYGWQPWAAVSAVVPGLAQARNVFRFAYFVQMATVLGAAQCLFFLLLLRRRYLKSRVWRGIASAAILALGFGVVFETLPAKMTFASVPDAASNSAWIDFVRDHTPPGRSVVSIPFAAGNNVEDFEPTTRAMYFGTFHRVPLLNGYSGFFPNEYYALRQLVNDSFPGQEVLRRLADANVEFVILMPSAPPLDMAHSSDEDLWALEPAFDDPAGVKVYRLVRRE